jgi:hypothetical protein
LEQSIGVDSVFQKSRGCYRGGRKDEMLISEIIKSLREKVDATTIVEIDDGRVVYSPNSLLIEMLEKTLEQCGDVECDSLPFPSN